jgi:superfamily I DNA and RNA helicase
VWKENKRAHITGYIGKVESEQKNRSNTYTFKKNGNEWGTELICVAYMGKRKRGVTDMSANMSSKGERELL